MIRHAHGEAEHHVDIGWRRTRFGEGGDRRGAAQGEEAKRLPAFMRGDKLRAEFGFGRKRGPDRHQCAAGAGAGAPARAASIAAMVYVIADMPQALPK